MLVVASSNAQAKNISIAKWKARTLHSAAYARVQEMVIRRCALARKLPRLSSYDAT